MWPKTLFSVTQLYTNTSIPLSPSTTIAHTLTSHGTEPKTLFCIIVGCGATPLHAISAPICSAVSVVSAIVEVGELAQSTIRITTSCYHNRC